MGSDELKIVLEDVKEKFDTVIEGYNLLSGKIDRLAKQNEAEHQQLRPRSWLLKRTEEEEGFVKYQILPTVVTNSVHEPPKFQVIHKKVGPFKCRFRIAPACAVGREFGMRIAI